MATHDYVIANQSGAAFRTDLNNALAAIVSNNSNSSSPATTYAYQWWADTSAGVLKIRNSANNAWIELLQLDGTLTLEDGSASSPALGFRDDLNTGLFSPAADALAITTAGSERIRVASAGQIGIGGANYGSSGQVLTSQGASSAVQWATVTGTTINNNANNRVITGSGTANTLEAEANLSYTGTNLTVQSGAHDGGVEILAANNNQSTRAKIQGKSSGGTEHNWFVEVPRGSDVLSIFSDGHGTHTQLDENGNLNITDGNLSFASGHGIDFSANSNASGSSSELLADYEEGTWTPDARDGSCTNEKAFYVKVGSMVTLHCKLTSFTDNSTNDQVTITGIPFGIGSAKADVAHGSAMYSNISETNNTTCSCGHARQGFNFFGGDSGAFSQIRHNELNSSSRIDFIATYFAF